MNIIPWVHNQQLFLPWAKLSLSGDKEIFSESRGPKAAFLQSWHGNIISIRGHQGVTIGRTVQRQIHQNRRIPETAQDRRFYSNTSGNSGMNAFIFLQSLSSSTGPQSDRKAGPHRPSHHPQKPKDRDPLPAPTPKPPHTRTHLLWPQRDSKIKTKKIPRAQRIRPANGSPRPDCCKPRTRKRRPSPVREPSRGGPAGWPAFWGAAAGAPCEQSRAAQRGRRGQRSGSSAAAWQTCLRLFSSLTPPPLGGPGVLRGPRSRFALLFPLLLLHPWPPGGPKSSPGPAQMLV